MEMFLKRNCKLMFKFDVYFRNIEVMVWSSWGISNKIPFLHGTFDGGFCEGFTSILINKQSPK